MPVKCRSPRRSEARINHMVNTTRKSTRILPQLRRCRRRIGLTQNCRHNKCPRNCQRLATRGMLHVTCTIESIPTICSNISVEFIHLRTRLVPSRRTLLCSLSQMVGHEAVASSLRVLRLIRYLAALNMQCQLPKPLNEPQTSLTLSTRTRRANIDISGR